MCIGTVIMWVQYNATAAKTWRVIVYSAQHPGGLTVASRTFTLKRGWYWWGFGVHQAYQGLSAVCVTATESFGMSCVALQRAGGLRSPVPGSPTGRSTVTAQPMAGQQGQFDLQAVRPDGTPQALLGLAHPVLDRVLVQHETFGRRFVAAVLLQEDPQRVAQPGVVLVVIGQRPQRLGDPGLQQLDRA